MLKNGLVFTSTRTMSLSYNIYIFMWFIYLSKYKMACESPVQNVNCTN